MSQLLWRLPGKNANTLLNTMAKQLQYQCRSQIEKHTKLLLVVCLCFPISFQDFAGLLLTFANSGHLIDRLIHKLINSLLQAVLHSWLSHQMRNWALVLHWENSDQPIHPDTPCCQFIHHRNPHKPRYKLSLVENLTTSERYAHSCLHPPFLHPLESQS